MAKKFHALHFFPYNAFFQHNFTQLSVKVVLAAEERVGDEGVHGLPRLRSLGLYVSH